jgi:two-component system, chemotaxis family, sensor kinase CheA
MKPSSPGLRRVLDTFAVEHREHLQRLSHLHQALGNNGENDTTYSNALRSLHSLKGTARLLNFNFVERICHLGETLLAKRDDSTIIESWLGGLIEAIEDGIGASLKGQNSSSAESFYNKLSTFLGENSLVEESSEASHLSPQNLRNVNVPAVQLEALVQGLARLAQQPHGFQDAISQLSELESHLPASHKATSRRLTNQLKNYCDQWSRSLGQLSDLTHHLMLIQAQHCFGEFGSRVREKARELGKEVKFELIGGQTLVELTLLQSLLDPLNHLLTNSIFHGIEAPEDRILNRKSREGKVTLSIRRARESLIVELSDDGQGINEELVRQRARKMGLDSALGLEDIIFSEGFSTSESVTPMGGRGIGLSAVRERIEELSGRIDLENSGTGLSWKMSFSSGTWGMHVLEVQCAGTTYAFPSSRIKRLRRLPISELHKVDGTLNYLENGKSIPILEIASFLGLQTGRDEAQPTSLSLVEFHPDVLTSPVRVDNWLSHRLVVVQPIPGGGWPGDLFEGAYPALNDKLTLVLNPRAICQGQTSTPRTSVVTSLRKPKSILLVDDSRTVRQMASAILINAGYQVTEAENGLEAWTRLQNTGIDLVITDIEMPEFDGLQLLKKLRDSGRNLPVILLTSLEAREQQQAGFDLGADAYLLKQNFDHRSLIDNVRRLI